jgi:uncharacterized protein DUF3108
MKVNIEIRQKRHPLRPLAGDPWIPHLRPWGMTALLFLLGTVTWAEPSNESFFPMEKGTAWVYKTTQKGKSGSFDMNVVIEAPWKGSSGSGMIMTQKDKRGTMRQFLVENENGIFIDMLALSKAFTPEVTTRFSPAVPLLIFPLVPGTKVHWGGRLKVAWVDKPIVFDGEVVGWEDMEVPAGKFHCIKLHYHEKRGEEIIDETAWYAEGVGQVKYDGGKYIKELVSFKKP